MYKLQISPEQVQETLSKHVLADGYDLTFDMEKSEGVYIYDSKHKRKLLDLFTCFASVPLGYNHPKMLQDEDFKKDLMFAALTNPSNSDIYTQQYAQFVSTFSRVGIPNYLPHAFFISGGGLAIENALKAAMDWKVQKNFAKGHTSEKGFQVIHFTHAFHGRTGYTLSLTNTLPVKTKWFAKFDWPRIDTPVMRFPLDELGDQSLLEQEDLAVEQIKKSFLAYPDDICAIIIEPVQSEGGDNHISHRFMKRLRQLADENDVMLIFDEIQTGVGLSGKFWCHQHFGDDARPDIIAFGKKMQVCGILAGNKIDEIQSNVFKVPSRINSTWGGNLTDMVRATKILNIIEEDELCNNAAKTGTYLQQQLLALSQKNDKISNVRGKGLLTAFDLPDKATRDNFITRGLENNVMFLGCAEKSIRFRPALTMKPEHIDIGLEVIEKILR